MPGSLIDSEIKTLVLHSALLTVFSGIVFFISSFDNPYNRDYLVCFTSFLALFAGVCGCVQGCKKNKNLLLNQEIALAVSILMYIISIFNEFIEFVYSVFYYWGVDSGKAAYSLWGITLFIVVIFFLLLGILFAERVRLNLSGKISGLNTALL